MNFSVRYVAVGALAVSAAMPAQQVDSIVHAPPAALAALLSAQSTSSMVANTVIVPNTILDQEHEVIPPAAFKITALST